MKHLVVFCVASVLLLVGCTTKENFAAYADQPLKLSVYKSGHIDQERTILPSSPEHRALVSWFAEHQTGWKSSWVTYAPQIRIAGTNVTVDIQSNAVIVNAAGKQCVRDAAASDFDFLKHEPSS